MLWTACSPKHVLLRRREPEDASLWRRVADVMNAIRPAIGRRGQLEESSQPWISSFPDCDPGCGH